MIYPFTLPTTSSIDFSTFFDSVTHPSLPLAATTRRSVLKDALKKHKRLSQQAKEAHVQTVHDAILNYLPYLNAISAGSSYRDIGPEKIDVQIKTPFQAEWRSTLSNTKPGLEPSRVLLIGLHHELAFTLLTLSYTHTLLARTHIRRLPTTSDTPTRTILTATAIKHLQSAQSIQTHLLTLPLTPSNLPSNPSLPTSSTSHTNASAPIDLHPTTLTSLASLSLASATSCFIAKDDPYTAAVSSDRDASNSDWMFRAPSLPRVRASLFARICLAAAGHAGEAEAGLKGVRVGDGSGKAGVGKVVKGIGIGGIAGGSAVDEGLVEFAGDLAKMAKARAGRFLAVEAEGLGKTGEALGWVAGARRMLGFGGEGEEGRRTGLKGLRMGWREKREDRKVGKGGEWGLDGGRLEEARVLEMLEAKWERENSTVNVQVVSDWQGLYAELPSGREAVTPVVFVMPVLDEESFARMRAPPEPDELAFRGEEDDSGDEANESASNREPVGAFPGTAEDYGRSATSASYY